MMPCQKMKFVTKQDAKDYIKERRSRSKGSTPQEPGKVRPYKCTFHGCDYWHLTTQSKAEQRQHKKRTSRRSER